MLETATDPGATSLAAAAGVLVLGFLLGLRHATEADHIAAVGAIVSERRGWRAAAQTGALWGLGHTVAILVAGLFVLGLQIAIPAGVAQALEVGVALMIIALGSTALARALRSRPDVHVHAHTHSGRTHAHLHFHGPADGHVPAPSGRDPVSHGPLHHRSHDPHDHGSHHDRGPAGPGFKPFLVGIVHGLAGSAALTLLVLARIGSVPLGLAYLLLFGAGSIGGMMVMSLAISVPFAATIAWPLLHRSIRLATGLLSVAFGLFHLFWQIAGGAGA